MRHVLSVDAGTTNLKAALVDVHGRMTRLHQVPLSLSRPELGAAEHDPQAIYKAFTSICRLVSAGHSSQISALAISSYNLGLLPVDVALRPLTGVITLQDTRSRESYPQLRRACDLSSLYRRTGCPPLFHYPLAKIWWLKETRPEIFRKTRFFLGLKDYLIYRLLGFPCTDAGLASCSQMFDIHKLCWDNQALRVLGIKPFQLPSVVPADVFPGRLNGTVAKGLGLAQGTPLLSGFYDGAALALGLGGLEKPGLGIMSLGTTAMLRRVTEKPIFDKSGRMRFQTVYLYGHKYFPGGGVNNAGNVLAWLSKNLLHADVDTLLQEARKARAGSAGITALPFLTGERDPRAGDNRGGSLFGLRAEHNRGHIARACLEGVAYFTRTILEALEQNGPKITEIRIGGGGSQSKLWLEIMAGVLGKRLRVSHEPQPALLGNAIAAFKALGAYGSLEQASKAMTKAGGTFRPDRTDTKIYREGFGKFERIIESQNQKELL